MQNNRYRWQVLGRVVAAVFGAYAVTASWVAVLSLALPWAGLASRAQAVQMATLTSFLVYLILVLWIFGARSVRKVWITLGVAAAALGVLFLMLPPASW